MGIPLISNIEQANNGEFWLVDSNAIYGGLYHVNVPAERDSLPTQRLKVGMLCYVLEEDTYYKYTEDGSWILFSTGAGMNYEVIDQEEIDEMKNIFNNDTV